MLRVAALLAVLSALCTVAVAWSCALWSPIEKQPAGYALPGWPPPDVARLIPPNWLNTKFAGGEVVARHAEFSGFGFAVQRTGMLDYVPGRLLAGGPDPAMHRFRCGWPLPCLEGIVRQVGSQPPSVEASLSVPELVRPRRLPAMSFTSAPVDPVLPMRVLLPGFVADTLIYLAALSAPLVAGTLLHQLARRHRSRCGTCGYSLVGLPLVSACPECGESNQ